MPSLVFEIADVFLLRNGLAGLDITATISPFKKIRGVFTPHIILVVINYTPVDPQIPRQSENPTLNLILPAKLSTFREPRLLSWL